MEMLSVPQTSYDVYHYSYRVIDRNNSSLLVIHELKAQDQCWLLAPRYVIQHKIYEQHPYIV